MASRAVKRSDRISHSAISVPVRPSPALQCTATTPSAASTACRKASTTVSGGQVQSSNSRLWCAKPRDVSSHAS